MCSIDIHTVCLLLPTHTHTPFTTTASPTESTEPHGFSCINKDRQTKSILKLTTNRHTSIIAPGGITYCVHWGTHAITNMGHILLYNCIRTDWPFSDARRSHTGGFATNNTSNTPLDASIQLSLLPTPHNSYKFQVCMDVWNVARPLWHNSLAIYLLASPPLPYT